MTLLEEIRESSSRRLLNSQLAEVQVVEELQRRVVEELDHGISFQLASSLADEPDDVAEVLAQN